MIGSKLGPSCLCVIVLGAMAVSASSAQGALSWLVLNASKTTATELKAALGGEADSSKLALFTTLGGLGVEISCTSFEPIGINLEPGGKLTEGGKAKFTGCLQLVEGEVPCGQHTSGQPEGTIVTNELKGELILHTLAEGESEVLAKIEPKVAGGPFAQTFTNEECPAFEGIPIRGILYLKDSLGQATTHAVKHLLEAGPLTALFVGTKIPVTEIEGSVWVKLANAHAGLSWSGMDV